MTGPTEQGSGQPPDQPHTPPHHQPPDQPRTPPLSQPQEQPHTAPPDQPHSQTPTPPRRHHQRNTHILHFLVRLPRPMESVWPALATAEGLGAWFTDVEVLEPRLGGAVALRGLGGGRVTAWDVDRVAEYTVEPGGRLRFHLERDGATASTLRFTHEFRGERESEQRWRARFERLVALPEAPGAS
ncbi:hypothetical protein ACFRI7_03635 [Streptomyces sp. NPDC056716]|uniref:hypothetical protein n=1 Tax=unclassified Streptomyces TaxID=2593676 RepID=UPI0036C90CA5